ncbi:MAG: TonB-dependent receptor domain-containing protein [Candidatus Acidiferrales bacterium]
MIKLVRGTIAILALLVGLVCVSGGIQAQSVASVTGTVTDNTGATVPGASVQLQDTRTGNSYFAKTASDGTYRIVDVPPGPGYSLTVKKDGFQTFVLGNLYLPVATATTEDVKLGLGTLSQTVEVTAEGSVTLNTTDATIGHELDMHAIDSLPDEFRDNPGNLLRLETGVVSAQVNNGQAKRANLDPNGTRDGSVAGARADQNNIIVDGIDATDFRTGQAFAIESSIPVEAIQEFNTQVAQPGVLYGGRGGSQTIITTKSGTNDWHGSAFEYNRTAATEANTYFNKQDTPITPRLALVRNQFGANVGGPVLKDKLFFFFEYDGRRDASGLSAIQIVPFPHVGQGELAYINDTPGCTKSARLTSADTSTTCVTIAPAAAVTALDPCSTASCSAPGFVQAGPAPVLTNVFAHRYPAPNDFTDGDGVNTAGFRFNAPDPDTENSYLGRVDYNLNSKNRLFGRFNIINSQTVNLNNGLLPYQFPGDPLTALETARNRAWVVGDTWTINSNTINQFTYGETRANEQFPISYNPAGGFYELSFFGSFEGSSFATPYERQTSAGDYVPDPTVRDDVTFVHGKHTLQFGFEWNPTKVRSSLTNDFVFVQEGLGGAVTGLNSAFRPANINTDPTVLSEWDNVFMGDLGIIWNYQAAINYTGAGVALPPGSGAKRDWRINEYAGYLQDTWKILPDLTITAGVRYQYQQAPYEVHGTEAQFFNTNLASIVDTRIANGLAGISGFDATPLVTYQLAGKGNGGQPLYHADKNDFSPRLGLAWNPSFTDGFLGNLFGDRKTVLRAGAGLIYDESVIYAITNFEDQSNYLFGNTVASEFNAGNTDIANDIETDPRMNSLSVAPFPVVPPPFQTPLTPFAIFNDGIDPNLKTPYSITASLGLQRELPGGFQVEADYYGSFGRRLMQLGDVSQAMNFTDPTSKQTLVQAFSTLEQDSRQNSDAGESAVTVSNNPLPFFEHQIGSALAADGTTCAAAFAPFPLGVTPNCTAGVYLTQFGALQQGATGEIVASLPFPPNVGLTPQFYVDALMANKGFSNYNSLFMTVRKRLSRDLQFDFNYTYSHSIDNGSTVANEDGNFESGVTSVMCDVTNNRACRGNSEFDARHQISANFVYDLPFGRGQAFGHDVGTLLNEAIGGWQISGIETWRTGLAFTVNNTSDAFYDTVSLAADTGMLFTGTQSQVRSNIHIDPTEPGSPLQFFASQSAAAAAFSPVTGLQSGNRDTLHGPHFSNLDLSVAKKFPLVNERYNLTLRAEAYNVFNHPNFGLPDTGALDGNFGVITGLAGQEPSRVMQFALRFDF